MFLYQKEQLSNYSYEYPLDLMGNFNLPGNNNLIVICCLIAYYSKIYWYKVTCLLSYFAWVKIERISGSKSPSKLQLCKRIHFGKDPFLAFLVAVGTSNSWTEASVPQELLAREPLWTSHSTQLPSSKWAAKSKKPTSLLEPNPMINAIPSLFFPSSEGLGNANSLFLTCPDTGWQITTCFLSK